MFSQPMQCSRRLPLTTFMLAALLFAVFNPSAYAQGAALNRTGWVATASDTDVYGDAAGNAIDGNTSSKWMSGVVQYSGMWFKVDMLSAQTFSQITMDSTTSATDYPRAYSVYVSNDGATWGTAVATGTATASPVTITFANQTARYIKIVQTGTSTTDWWSMGELNIYAPSTALSRTGWVGTASDTDTFGDAASRALDGSTSTKWMSGVVQYNGMWYKVDMLANQTFNKIVLDSTTSATDYPRAYSAYVSTDGVNFGAAVASGTATASPVTITFATQTARYIKIVQTGSSPSDWWSMGELNVYGSSGVITGITEANPSGAGAVAHNLQVGSTMYTDRNYTYSTVASGSVNLTGADYIQTANNNKAVSNYSLSYTLGQSATVYLLNDTRNAGLPTGTGAFSDTGATITSTSSSYKVYSALQSAGTYTLGAEVSSNNFYAVAAKAGGGPAAPTNLTATAGNTQVMLNWSAVSGAASYNVKRSTMNAGPYTTVSSPTAASYTNTGLTNGATYYYVVTAVNSSGESANSNQAGAIPVSSSFNGANIAYATTAPVIDGTIDAVWNNATQYNISNLTTGSTSATGTFKMLWDTNNLYVLADITDGALIANTSVWNGDSVEVYIDGDNNKSSTYDSNDFQYAFPWSGTAITESKHSPGSLTGVVFAQANRAGGYRMEMKLPLTTAGISPVGYSQIGTDVQFNDSIVLGSRAGKRAWWATADNVWNNPGNMGSGQLLPGTGAPPATPAGLTATSGNYQISLAWSAASGAVVYNLKRATISGGPFTVVAHPTTLSYIDTGLTGGMVYYYILSASNANGEGGGSSQASATSNAILPVAPSYLGAKPGDSQIGLSWLTTQGATSYNVKRATTNGGPYTTIAAQVPLNGYLNTGLTNGTTYYYAVTALNASGEGPISNQASGIPAVKTISTANYMGMNLEGISDYSVGQAFVDTVKQGRRFGIPNQPWDPTGINIDSNGWPTQDAGICLITSIPSAVSSTPYKLSFTGQAVIDYPATDAVTQNQVYNSGTNTTTADVLLNSGTQLYIGFTSTKRLPTDAPGTGITNLKVLRPGYTTETYTTNFKNEIAKFQAIRFMDWQRMNSNQVANWADRATTTYGPWASRTFGSYYKDGSGNPIPESTGLPWETCIQLSNELNEDMWVNIPLLATDDYVTQLATLLKNTLNANLKIYVEYSNEVWNSGYGFSQGVQNPTMAQTEVNAGDSNLAYDGVVDYNINGWRRTARRTKEISNIFRTVFGDAAMFSRVRPVLESQLGNTEPLKYGMRFLEDVYGSPSDYIYGCGGSDYYGPDSLPNPMSIDQVFVSNPGAYYVPAILIDVDWSQTYGIKRIAYEGGMSLDGSNLTDTVRAGVLADARMRQAQIDEHNTWSANGGDLLMYFTSSGSTYWGFTQDTTNIATYKLQGIDALNTTARAVVTAGTVVTVPLTINAGQFSLVPGYGSAGNNPITLTSGVRDSWCSYLIRTTTAGTYKFNVSAGSANANGKLQIFADGDSLGQVAIPSTGSTSVYADTVTLSAVLTAGLHAIRIKAVADSFSVQNFKVTQ